MEYEMEEEEPRIDPAQFLAAVIQAPNVAELLPDEDLGGIAEDVCREYRIDAESMKTWLDRMKKGLDLASLVKEDKTYPFEKSANVKYPLITTAALQFNARAYPAIVPNDEVVKVKTFGRDQGGAKAARADRVSAHMSWQLSAEIEEWEESTDELLTILPIVGTVVRKMWYDPAYGRARCRLIHGGAFIVNNSVKTLSDAPRISEVLSLYPNEVSERKRSGVFRNVDYIVEDGEDRDAPQEFIEQHRRLDLDEDGYAEPYIVTVHKSTRKVARIVADFRQEDVKLGQAGVMSIKRGSYFVPYHFLPSITGGFHGTGLGFLLGDISETINSVINLMMDAGHMASRGGGFIGSEFRIKGGSQQFKPGEWRMANARGGDVRSAIVPLTFPGPDATLFQLLGLLIEAGKEVASVKDIMTGEQTRQMTATTTLALIEQGMAVFTAAYKRIFRSLKQEFKLLARINAETLDAQTYSMFHDAMDPQGMPMLIDPARDYDMSDMDITPVADPRSVTRMQETAKAQVVMEMAQAGLLDKSEATMRILQAASIADAEALLPKPDPMQQTIAQMTIKGAEADLTLKMVEVEKALADIQKTRSEVVKNLSDAAATDAQIRLDQAELALKAVSDGLREAYGRSAGGMASAPGYGNAGGGNAGPIQGPAPFGGAGLLGGQPMAGIGAPVPPQNGGIPGGLV